LAQKIEFEMKKIVPKNSTPSPAELEASFQKVVTQTPLPPVVEPVREVETPKTKREGRSRVTIDLPDNIFALMETHKEETGQNMTHLVTQLLKKFFTERGQL
jgi:hypothetical protein